LGQALVNGDFAATHGARAVKVNGHSGHSGIGFLHEIASF
jgi:hypothetical protein